MPCPRSRSLLKWSTFYISSLTQITKITKVCRRRSPRATSCQRTKRRPSTPFAPRPWTAPIQRSPQPLIKSPMPPHPLAFLFLPHHGSHGMLNHVHCSSKKACSTQLPGRCFRCLQVKKGNKLYADDLTQLRSNPEDFQSEEEAADSASEVRGGCGLEKKDWENEDAPLVIRLGDGKIVIRSRSLSMFFFSFEVLDSKLLFNSFWKGNFPFWV